MMKLAIVQRPIYTASSTVSANWLARPTVPKLGGFQEPQYRARLIPNHEANKRFDLDIM